jgi:selT/selW/selH-like putative selenoprotein
LEAKINEELGIEAKLAEGENGIFDVIADGEVVFSKHTAGRFPDTQEIIDILRARMPAQ